MGQQAPKSIFSADQDATILAIIASGVSVGLVKESDALPAERAGKVIIWKEDCLELDLFFVYNRDRQTDPLIQAISEVVRQTWNVEATPEKLK
jgi:DNA-binding transcriptional LysR family regulator